jgi:hypothetical protein
MVHSGGFCVILSRSGPWRFAIPNHYESVTAQHPFGEKVKSLAAFCRLLNRVRKTGRRGADLRRKPAHVASVPEFRC